MSWDAIGAVGGVAPQLQASPLERGVRTVEPAEVPPAGGFGDLVTKGVGEVNRQLLASQADLQALAVGKVENLHQVMIRLEESRLSFQLLLQVRNRLLEAYQDVMRMQL